MQGTGIIIGLVMILRMCRKVPYSVFFVSFLLWFAVSTFSQSIIPNIPFILTSNKQAIQIWSTKDFKEGYLIFWDTMKMDIIDKIINKVFNKKAIIIDVRWHMDALDKKLLIV